MERLQRAAVMLSLIEKLKAQGSWCGETHVQKATYFLQELMDVPLGFDFILYKHGPYSFDLSDEITAMRADTLLRLEPHPPYGPNIFPGNESAQVKRRYSGTIARYCHETTLVAKWLGSMRVMDLECVATALYVVRESDTPADIDARAQRINDIKPHVSLDDARKAVDDVNAFSEEAQSIRAAL